MGPERRYALLVEPLLAPATAYARSLVRHRQNAQDAVQEAALRGLERFATYDSRRPFKGWWFSIVHNCCIDLLRRSAAARTQPLEDSTLPPAPDGERPEWESLAAAMEDLSEPHREILRLRYFGDLDYRELAEALKIPPGTVMSRLHLARKALQARLREEESP